MSQNVVLDIDTLVADNPFTSYEAACALIGKDSNKGKIIGVTGKPGLKYREGIYLTCTMPNEEAKHYRVGEQK